LPPKRVRASQESSGLPSIAVSTAPRQSRSSTTGMSTGKRVSSVSRLPLPSVATAGQKRSSSSGSSVLAERNRNTMTPSSSRIMSKRDTFTTPQRVSVAPQPRMSLAGTASKRMSGRGSQMGARTHKDTRPLTDKEYQKEETRKILDFLREKKYGNTSLTTKHFPLTSKLTKTPGRSLIKSIRRMKRGRY